MDKMLLKYVCLETGNHPLQDGLYVTERLVHAIYFSNVPRTLDLRAYSVNSVMSETHINFLNACGRTWKNNLIRNVKMQSELILLN